MRLNQKRLEKARRDSIRRLKEDMGYMEHVEPTEMGLGLAIMQAASWVERVEWKKLDATPLLATARLRMKWWAYPTFGVLHFLALKRAREIVDRYKAAGVVILVSVWG